MSAPEEVLAAMESALREVNQAGTAEPSAIVAAVVAILRDRAREWQSSDLMDAAAWLEGSL